MLKQKSKESDWQEILNTCDKTITQDRLRELEQKAIRDIRLISKREKCAYGYSGGKDSVVLKSLVQKACVDITCFCSLTSYEYPAMERFIKATAPLNAIFLETKDATIDYLNEHPQYLFPEETDKVIRSGYTKHWRAVPEKYLHDNGYSSMITGRRIEDGNFCGRVLGDGIYISQNKLIKSYNIIADWTHEELLAYIKINNLPLAPIYKYPNGFKYGTHMWIERDRVSGSIEKTFDEVWAIDKSIVINTAKAGLIEAQKYLRNKTEGNYENSNNENC